MRVVTEANVVFVLLFFIVIEKPQVVSSTDAAELKNTRNRIRRARVRHDFNNASVDSIFQKPDQAGRRSFSCDQIDYRLTRIEAQLSEKTDRLHSELRESTRRIEWQNEEMKQSLEGLKNQESENSRTGSDPTPNSDFGELERRIEDLSKGIHLVIVALRTLNADMSGLKRNISVIAEEVQNLHLNTDHLVTKHFLTNSLTDLKQPSYRPNRSPYPQHEQQPSLIHHSPPSSCPGSPRQQQERNLPRNCKEVLQEGHSTSGIYQIQPELAPRPFMVLCDMTTRGGGWTFIHNRYDGQQDFYQDWETYRQGFGNLGGEFWLGLEYLHQLTGSEVNELLVELVDMKLQKAHAHYEAFSVGSESEGYPLKIVGGYSGDAGDSLMYHGGSKFSTKDLDQDRWAEGSCAKAHGGAWWYRSCDASNLNGKYLSGELPPDYIYQGMYWGGFGGPQYSLLQARMMIRPREENVGGGGSNSSRSNSPGGSGKEEIEAV